MGIFDWLFGKKSKDSEIKEVGIEKRGEVKKKENKGKIDVVGVRLREVVESDASNYQGAQLFIYSESIKNGSKLIKEDYVEDISRAEEKATYKAYYKAKTLRFYND